MRLVTEKLKLCLADHLIACLLMLGAASIAAAQPAGYTKLNVKGRVQIELPDD